jgi:hypothetical protein
MGSVIKDNLKSDIVRYHARMHAQILSESTYEAIRLSLSEKFLAEGQPEIGRNGQVVAALSHRCKSCNRDSLIVGCLEVLL